METAHVQATRLLDVDDPRIQELVAIRGWRHLPERERIGAVYDYVREEVAFGYSAADDIPASAVIADGYGQCNTKTTLLMALLRAVDVPCRFHGATIHKRLQRGVVPALFYPAAPESIVHSWAEVHFDGRWVGLEGVILDDAYLDGVRTSIHPAGGPFLGYAVGTDDLASPPIMWEGRDTAIQATGVNRDFGIFEDPDAFYRQHGSNLSGPRALLYRHVVRRAMNRNVAAIRADHAVSAARDTRASCARG